MVCLNTTLASSSDSSCIVTVLPQSVFLVVKWQEEDGYKGKRGFLNGEIQADLTHPKHIYFLMCYCASSQRRLFQQAE